MAGPPKNERLSLEPGRLEREGSGEKAAIRQAVRLRP